MALPAATAALRFRGSVEPEAVGILNKALADWNEFLSLAEVREMLVI